MKDRHILDILDGRKFAEIEGGELETIRTHAADCADCRRAFEAAQLSALLLSERAAAPAIEPSAFFQSKVLAALREKQARGTSALVAFRRWWQASYALVCSMMLVVVTLALLTIFAPQSSADQAVSNFNLYTTDSIILNQRPPQNLTNEQVLEVIYTERREAVRR